MKTPALLVILTVGLLALTGCDSVTVVERHRDRRPYGYHGGSYYSQRHYDRGYDRRYRRDYDNRYDSRRVYSRSAPRRSGFISASSRGARVVVRDSNRDRRYRGRY